MNTVRIPKIIQFGENALSEAEYPKNALVVTTAPPALSGKWLDRMGIQDYMLYDKIKPESIQRESKLKKGLIWVGANDGPVHVTTNGGKNWKMLLLIKI